ncbi:MAG: hypothetical protein Q4C83_00760 [Candidatus Saccharibacteria bacterium]|nr:hypothetical protein [Candidatus Saccharibacteria bacterium]
MADLIIEIIAFMLTALLFASFGFIVWRTILAINRRLKQIKQARRQLELAAQKDKMWSREYLLNYVSLIVKLYCSDISNHNIESMRRYVMPRFLELIQMQLRVMTEMKRSYALEVVKDLKSSRFTIVEMNDSVDNQSDFFDMEISFDCLISIFDLDNGAVLSKEPQVYRCLWHFVRDGNVWRLADDRPPVGVIDIDKELGIKKIPELQQYATAKQAFYLAQADSTMLPTKGWLCGYGNAYGLGKYSLMTREQYRRNHQNRIKMEQVNKRLSDYVIGQLPSGEIYQLYNYNCVLSDRTNADSKQLLVGQINLPKYYESIIVKNRGMATCEYGYQMEGQERLELEWNDFNKKFYTYISPSMRIPALELLHPAMMEKLVAATFDINIEVVNNTVYCFALKSHIALEDYDYMLDILKLAYDELMI